MEELKQLETKIILARPQVFDLMNANPLPGQQDGQGAAAQPIAQQQQPPQPAAAGVPIARPAIQSPILLAQQPPAAQAPANAQMFFPVVNMLSEEGMLCLAPFSGRADGDATEFWRRFQNYLEFKPILADADRLRLIKAMCIDQAADWAEKLKANERATFNAFKQAFESR